MKINTVKIFVVILIMFVNISCITAGKDSLYYDALQDIKSGYIDFAYIKLNNYLLGYPNSVNNKKVRFAIAEYFFQINDYRDAIDKLVDYIKDYPGEQSTVFAQAFLYKALLEYKTEPELIQKIKDNFFSRALFLIFSESKVNYYKSILNNTYKIIEYIDKIEIFKNNELFLTITP